ncbi:hypothetical protein AAMO2058_001285900 [Amorphochlora amoebiformis]
MKSILTFGTLAIVISAQNVPKVHHNHNSHCVVWLEKSLGLYIQPISLNNTEEDGNVGVCRFKYGERWNIGTYTRGPRRGEQKRDVDCVTGNGSHSKNYEVAAKSHECIVWWHEQAFNALPLPLMTSFAATPSGTDGICKVRYGRNDVVIGRLHGAEGGEYAKCEHYRDGKGVMLEGGFALLGAYDRRRPYEATIGKDQLRPRSELLAEFNHAVSKYLTQNDRNMLQSITGYPVSDLVADIQNESVITLMKILSSDRWIYSELNVKGLHLLRCVLAERITDARRKDHGMHLHEDYETFMRDGMLLKDFSKMTNEDVQELLMMISGFEASQIPDLTWQLRVVEAEGCDLNLDLHVDTYHPSWKVWLYAEDIDESNGPMNFVKGSHRNDIKKLTWLHQISNYPPVYGPGSYGSFRMDSVDCNADFSTKSRNETKWGYEERTAVVGEKMTLVVADVSGLHARGIAAPGKLRRTFIIGGGGEAASMGGLPRINPFSYASRRMRLENMKQSKKPSKTLWIPSELKVERIRLHKPNLEDLAIIAEDVLSKHFEYVSAKVVRCPDLSVEPWNLAAPGISGGDIKVIDVGGEHHQVFDYANQLTFSLEELADAAGVSDKAYFLGAGAAPRASIGCNGELIPVDNLFERVRRSQLATVENDSEGQPVRSILTPYESSEMGFLSNLLMSRGEPGDVLQLEVSKRTSKNCSSLTECLRRGIAEAYKGVDLPPIGLGGVFRVNSGKVKTHVMADTGGKTLKTSAEVQDYLKIFNIGPGLTAATVFVSKSPQGKRMSKVSRFILLTYLHTHVPTCVCMICLKTKNGQSSLIYTVIYIQKV